MNTAAKMMAEVASDHVYQVTNIDQLPIVAGYNFELCIRHLEKSQSNQEEATGLALGDLRILVSAFRSRWPRHEGDGIG